MQSNLNPSENTEANSNNMDAEKNTNMDCLPPPPVNTQNFTENMNNNSSDPQRNVKLNDKQFEDFIELIMNLNPEQKNKLREVLINDETAINATKQTTATQNKKSGHTIKHDDSKTKSKSTPKKKVDMMTKIANLNYSQI